MLIAIAAPIQTIPSSIDMHQSINNDCCVQKHCPAPTKNDSERPTTPADLELKDQSRLSYCIIDWSSLLLGSWQVLMRCVASALFLVAHGLLVLEHIAIGTALHGVAELFLAPWAIRHRAWDIIIIGLIFCVFDLWGTVRLVGVA